jgi:hypothetical protein
MKGKALLFGAAFVAAYAAPNTARSDDAGPARVRHLQYAVSVGVQTRHDVTTFGGLSHFDSGELTATGTVTADVVGVAAGNSLVISVSENTNNRKAPPIRVVVLDQGQVTFDDKDASNLNEEELVLAALIGRAVVADHDLVPNYHWRLSRNLERSADSTTFRVVSLVGDSQVNLELERTVKVTGAQPFDMTAHGRVLYDYKRSIPVSGQIMEQVHSPSSDPWEINARATTDISVEFRLAEDSLAASPATAGGSASAAP